MASAQNKCLPGFSSLFFYLVCNKQKEVVADIYAIYEWNERARLPERVWVAEF